VAARTARKARLAATRRLVRDRAAAARRSLAILEPPLEEAESRDELSRVLHEEIDRLPRSYRAAVVACYLEGMTQAQAARLLDLAESTVRGRLARARKLLGDRLTRRGVAPSTGWLALGRAVEAAAARLSEASVASLARTAVLFLRSGQATPGAVSATAWGLAQGVLSTMRFPSLKTLAATLIVIGLAVSGTAALMPREPAASPQARGSSRAKPVTPTSAMDPELVQRAPGPIVRTVPVSQDCMILAYLPNQNLGHVDNFGLGNNDGGVRALIDWPSIPREEAAAPDRRFLIALYSRKTTAHPPTGPIHAFEILEPWRELNSWRTQPRYDPEPTATYRFEPGDGWKLFDITAMVRAQAQAGRDGHGLLLRFLSEDVHGPNWSGYELVSREGAGEWTKRRPVLLVVKASTPEPTQAR
jgi:hypothetical protein